MEEIQINLPTVIVAAVLYMIIGVSWYSKWLFGPTFMKLHKERSEKEYTKVSLIYGFINALVIAYFLALFEAYMGATTVSDGMFVGFLTWLGFVATTQISPVIWGGLSLREFMLHTGCKLLAFLVMSGVIGA